MTNPASTSPPNEQKTKRQHYVPQFILRKFSQDGVHIAMALLSGKTIPMAQIKTQCQEHFFYGEDQAVEKAFSLEEGQVAKILGDLDRQRLAELSIKEIATLMRFTYYQRARTVAAGEHINAQVSAFAKAMLKTSMKVNHGEEVTKEDLEVVRVGYERPQDHALFHAAELLPIIVDMDLKFLVTDRMPGFVIADQPVALNNQYMEHQPSLQHLLSITGLGAKGLQMFFPVSPSVTVALFDPSAYDYGGKSRVCRVGPDDVRFMNELQAVNVHNALYFDPTRVEAGTIDALLKKRRSDRSPYERQVMMSDPHPLEDGTKSQFIAVGASDTRLGGKLSIVRLKDHFDYRGYTKAYAPPRSPELIEHLMGDAARRGPPPGAADGGRIELLPVKV